MKLVITIILALAYSSCTLTVNPDSSRTYGADPEVVVAILDAK